jgi:RNA polymerase sigma-70 factor (ECF subfamily)
MRSAVDPEDLVQEVWIRALKRFTAFDPDETPFRPWVFRIANNVLLEAFKALRNRPLPAGGQATSGSCILSLDAVPDEATSISRKAARNEALRRFIDQLGSLDEVERRLLIFRGLEGLSHAEVAERLQLGDDVVRKRWQRLREKLEAWGPPPELMEG